MIKKLMLLLVLFANNCLAINFNSNRAKEIKAKLNSASIINISDEGINLQISQGYIDENSQFYLGSITKHMTAYMLLKTLENKYGFKEINNILDKNLDQAFPGSNFLKDIEKEWTSKISIRELLTHESGLSDYTAVFYSNLSNAVKMNQPMDQLKLIKMAKFNPLKLENYSNTNFLILAKLVEEMQGVSFEDVFAELIARPSNMDNSYAPIKGNYQKLIQQNRFKNLVANKNNKVFIDMQNAMGAGNVVSTVKDLEKLPDFFANSENAKIRNIMLRPYGVDNDGDEVNLALGTTIINKNISITGHRGTLDSFDSFFGFAKDNKLKIIILSNDFEDFNLLFSEYLSKSLDGLN